MASYEATLQADEFAGLYQGGDGYGVPLKYAVSGKNFDVRGGTLTPLTTGTALPGEISGATIGTLAALFKRYSVDEGIVTPVDTTYLIAAAGANLYARATDAQEWTQIASGMTNDIFDFVTYEVNTRNGATTLAPVDVLLLTNADDGMFCVYSDDLSVSPVPVQPEGAAEPIKFGIICRHSERIWGAGIKSDPDKLMYSAPYDPFNWNQNSEIPEDGAGDILQPSWDGDRFIALRKYGSYLLAFKKERVWRVIGTNPGEYVCREQFGGGAILENTVAVCADSVLMLGHDGLMLYDGNGVMPFRQPYVEAVMHRVNAEQKARACAVVNGDTYMLALPLDESETNNAILEYSFSRQTFTLREGICARSFLAHGGELFYTSDAVPSAVFELGEKTGDALPMRWVSGWQDAGARNVVKGGFFVYLLSQTGMRISVSIETERRRKTKAIVLPAGKPKRATINVHGRFFRIILETTQSAWWNLSGGLQAVYELDPD